jgi:hypothetical protein
MSPMDFKTHEQAMGCLSCGRSGWTPESHFPQEPGLWDRPCPNCGQMTVWVTEPRERMARPEGEDLTLAEEHLGKAKEGLKKLKALKKKAKL